MEDNYPKAYKEVLEILKHMPQESVNKIPKTMIDTFKIKMDKNYDFILNSNTSFKEQELLDETKAILANIFRDYWATSYQKERIKEKEKNDRKNIEKEKSEKYNPDNLFIHKKNANFKEEQEGKNNLILYKENKFKKLFNKIKKMLHVI